VIIEEFEPRTDTVEEAAPVEACTKCTACNTVCPVARETDLFRGPKALGPEAERFRLPQEAPVVAGLDLDDRELTARHARTDVHAERFAALDKRRLPLVEEEHRRGRFGGGRGGREVGLSAGPSLACRAAARGEALKPKP